MKLTVIQILAGIILTQETISGQFAIYHESKVDIGGILKLDIKNNDIISRDKALLQSETGIASSLITEHNRVVPEKAASIIRLDKRVKWQLYEVEKEYYEQSFESIKNAPDPMGEVSKDKRESDYEWTSAADRLEGEKDFCGFKSTGQLAKAIGVHRKDKSDTVVILIEQWRATGVPGEEELNEFAANYAAAVGQEQVWGQHGVELMLRRFGAHFEELISRLAKDGGFPVRTIIEIESTPVRDLSQDNLKTIEKPEKTNKKLKRQKTLQVINEVKSIQPAPDSANFFEIPDNYRPR